MKRFTKTQDREYECDTWFERDRQMVCLSTPQGREIFCLWDEAVSEAVEDGFLKVPRTPRPNSKDWQPCAVAYAREMGYIN